MKFSIFCALVFLAVNSYADYKFSRWENCSVLKSDIAYEGSAKVEHGVLLIAGVGEIPPSSYVAESESIYRYDELRCEKQGYFTTITSYPIGNSTVSLNYKLKEGDLPVEITLFCKLGAPGWAAVGGKCN